jgi:hypothetical protein
MKRKKVMMQKDKPKTPIMTESRDRIKNTRTNGQEPNNLRQEEKQNKMPAIITRELIEAIAIWIQGNMYFSTACHASGIGERTGYVWKARGEKEMRRIEEGRSASPNEALYLEFFLATQKAEALAEYENIRCIQEHRPNWQANAWILTRRNRKRWGNGGNLENEEEKRELPQTFLFVMPDGTKITARELANAGTNELPKGNSTDKGTG